MANWFTAASALLAWALCCAGCSAAGDGGPTYRIEGPDQLTSSLGDAGLDGGHEPSDSGSSPSDAGADAN
ncbi:MAG TPA: hypothetical protein VNN80_32405 [Polyangiaceae bacterium]|jgi:hypothetical protein|nr:hypothetical protein [Polyangiaceae bacterium]